MEKALNDERIMEDPLEFNEEFDMDDEKEIKKEAEKLAEISFRRADVMGITAEKFAEKKSNETLIFYNNNICVASLMLCGIRLLHELM